MRYCSSSYRYYVGILPVDNIPCVAWNLDKKSLNDCSRQAIYFNRMYIWKPTLQCEVLNALLLVTDVSESFAVVPETMLNTRSLNQQIFISVYTAEMDSCKKPLNSPSNTLGSWKSFWYCVGVSKIGLGLSAFLIFNICQWNYMSPTKTD